MLLSVAAVAVVGAAWVITKIGLPIRDRYELLMMPAEKRHEFETRRFKDETKAIQERAIAVSAQKKAERGY